MNTTLRWLVSTFLFSRTKNLSTPYSWRVVTLTITPIGPTRLRSRTTFFLPRTCHGTTGVRWPIGDATKGGKKHLRGTYPLEKMEQVPPGLIPNLIRVERNSGHHHEHAMGA